MWQSLKRQYNVTSPDRAIKVHCQAREKWQYWLEMNLINPFSVSMSVETIDLNTYLIYRQEYFYTMLRNDCWTHYVEYLEVNWNPSGYVCTMQDFELICFYVSSCTMIDTIPSAGHSFILSFGYNNFRNFGLNK